MFLWTTDQVPGKWYSVLYQNSTIIFIHYIARRPNCYWTILYRGSCITRTLINSYWQDGLLLLDEVFVISRIIKVEVWVIIFTETLIILGIAKTDSNNCAIMHWTKKNGHESKLKCNWQFISQRKKNGSGSLSFFLFHVSAGSRPWDRRGVGDGGGGRAVIQTLRTYGPLFDFDVLPVQRQTLQTVTGYSYSVLQWALRFLLLQQKFMCKISRNKDKQALAGTIPPWLRYVDDTFTAVHRDEIDVFHEHLNRQNADIQFTKEIEENGKISFLDCLVTRDNNRLRTTINSKPTHPDRKLDQSSYNPTSHKATTIRTLTRRAKRRATRLTTYKTRLTT